jgi:glyoxylase-like metal-dependent hydrolase (beta-lactamase superfamily II)
MQFAKVFGVLTCAVLCSLAAEAQSNNLRQIVPGVWFRTGAPLILAHGEDITENTMIIEMRDYLVVIDSGTKDTARDTLADCKAISSKQVKYVFLTHHHFDHVSGNAVWTEAGATTISYPGVREEMLRSKSEFELPKKILDGDLFVLDDGNRRLEFHSYGWAHTRGDGVAYLPKERVLFTGDIAINASCNSFFDADLRNWPSVIRKLEALNPQYVLPGHGKPGSAELLQRQREYLESMISQVQHAIARGEKLDALVEMKNGQPVSSRLKFAPELATWAVGPFSAQQVEGAYTQLSK